MTEKRSRTERTADATGKVAGGVATAAGSAFGAAQARNEYRNTYGEKSFERQARRVGTLAASTGLKPKHQARLVEVFRHGKPRFGTLAAGSVAGGVAGGAHVVEEQQKRRRGGPVGKRLVPIEKGVRETARRAAMHPAAVDLHQALSVADTGHPGDIAAAAGGALGEHVLAGAKHTRRQLKDALNAPPRSPIGRKRVRKSATDSPFAIVKSQLADGTYKPATSLNRRDRDSVRGGVSNARGERAASDRPLEARGPRARRHGPGSAHAGYGVALGDNPTKFFEAKTTPSKVHSKIHYGPSVGPEAAKAYDRHFDSKLVGGLRHPVVVHHGDLGSKAYAAAAGAHQTTGHRGHIVVDPKLINHPGNRAGVGPTMNHELVHAGRRGNPRSLLASAKRTGGEEGRADALSGADAYLHNGAISRNRTAVRTAHGVFSGAAKATKGTDAGPGFKQAAEATAGAKSYHRVRDTVHTNTGNTAMTLRRHGKTALGVGALVGGAAYLNHQRVQKVADSAFSKALRDRDGVVDTAAGAAGVGGGALVHSGRKRGKQAVARQRESVAAHDAGRQARHSARADAVAFDQRLGRMEVPVGQPGNLRHKGAVGDARRAHAAYQGKVDEAFTHAERARNLSHEAGQLRRSSVLRNRTGLALMGAGVVAGAANSRRRGY